MHFLNNNLIVPTVIQINKIIASSRWAIMTMIVTVALLAKKAVEDGNIGKSTLNKSRQFPKVNHRKKL